MDLIEHVLNRENVDTVLHLAAHTHVDNSFGNSLAFTMNNTYGTHVLLEACRKHGKICRFVYASTDEVYGETSVDNIKGLTETSRLEPTNPYSAAKAGAEMLCGAYITSYGMPVIVTRGNNVYGPRQFPEKLVPKLVILASMGRDLPIHGDGSALRSYLYVDDVAEAFECVMRWGRVGEVYNIGTEEERSVADVAAGLAAHVGLTTDRIIRVEDRAFNDRRYYIGSAKLEALGWERRTGWDEGLAKTIDWYVRMDESARETYWKGGDVERALRPHSE
jgi:UDP-glucose 4,6-dehydratase